ncbi:MAG: hypothetical protein COA57_12445 [Flavobacteriales bacterium]|nr:MAG: hypothetical protein COA57_12445 [Flavobacteriales bacterium]
MSAQPIGIWNEGATGDLLIGDAPTSTNFLRVDGAGYLGIGAVPLGMLDVQGWGIKDSIFIFSNDLNTIYDSTIVFTSFGYLGIGTNSPGALLDVAGHIWQTGTGQSVFIGESAGAADDFTTNNNVYVGYQAGMSGTTRFGNTFIGSQAGRDNVANQNTFIGRFAGMLNTIGSGHVFIGHGAGDANTTGVQNTYVGYSAGTNSTGSENAFFGSFAGNANTSGGNNTFLGRYSGMSNTTAGSNTFVGYSAGYSNTVAMNNVAIGRDALRLQSYNPGFGYTSYNVAVGYRALQNNQPSAISNGVQNTAVGTDALQTNTSGRYNTAMGFQSLYQNATGNQSSAFGKEALYNATGGNNTAIGYQAGNFITTGTDNTFIGYNADATVATLTNATAIGANASVAASNSLILGSGANVGIGITNPEGMLHIRYAGAVVNPNQLQIGHSNQPTREWIFDVNSSGNLSVINENLGAPVTLMFINTLGNVGIGTTTPDGKLDVEGSAIYISEIAAPATPAATKGVLYEKSDGKLYFKNAGATEFDLTQGGGTGGWTDAGTVIHPTTLTDNVGIGATVLGTSATSVLGIANGTAPTTSPADMVQLWSADRAATVGQGSLHLRTENGTNHVFGDRVGIGTATPAEELDVIGQIAIGGVQAFDMNNNDLYIKAGSSTDWIAFQPNPGVNSVVMMGNGNVGISTASPAEKLDIGQIGVNGISTTSQSSSGRIALTGSYWDGTAEIKHRFNLQNVASTTVNETGRLAINWDATELISIQNDGNVGIGTTSPSTKLEVAGQVKITGGAPSVNKVLTSDAAGLATWETPALVSSGKTNISVTLYSGSDIQIDWDNVNKQPRWRSTVAGTWWNVSWKVQKGDETVLDDVGGDDISATVNTWYYFSVSGTLNAALGLNGSAYGADGEYWVAKESSGDFTSYKIEIFRHNTFITYAISAY